MGGGGGGGDERRRGVNITPTVVLHNYIYTSLKSIFKNICTKTPFVPVWLLASCAVAM